LKSKEIKASLMHTLEGRRGMKPSVEKTKLNDQIELRGKPRIGFRYKKNAIVI